MSVTIESATIGADTEKRLVLGNSQWAATLSVGTNWDKIRVACRVAVDDSAGNLTGTPRLYMGMASSPSSGFSNGPLSGITTKHFIGMLSGATSWTRNAGPPVNYTVSGNMAGKKVGSTITAISSTSFFHSAAPTTRRIPMIVQIEKGSPNFTVRNGFLGSFPAADYSFDDILSVMDVENFTAAVGLVGQSAVSNTIATDEAVDGFFNAFCVAWDRSVVDFHISEMTYAKFE